MLQWLNDLVNQALHVTFDVANTVEHDMDNLTIVMPPSGRLLLAIEDTGVDGCACMLTIGPGVAEAKRACVRPEHRRKGLGRALVQALILDVGQTGYTRLRLDTGRFMPEAQELYRSRGC
jgi:putative acetyltransferase